MTNVHIDYTVFVIGLSKSLAKIHEIVNNLLVNILLILYGGLLKMTFTLTLTDLLLAVLIVAGILVLVRLAQVLKELIPTLKHVANITADAEELTKMAKEKAEGMDEIIDNLKTGLSGVSAAVKGDQSFIKGASNLVNATTSLIGLVKNSNKKDEE